MNKLTFLLTTFITFSCYAQTSDVVKSRWQLGLTFSPDLCYRTFIYTGSSSFNIQEHLDENETIKFGYTSGLNIGYKLNGRFSFESGLLFSNKGYTIKEMELYYPSPEPMMPEKVKYRTAFHYIDVPLKVNMFFGKQRLRMIAGAGVVANVLLDVKSTSISTFSGGSVEKRQNAVSMKNFDQIGLSAMLNLGVDYQLNDQFSLRFEPTFRHQVISNSKYDYKNYLYNAGLNLGLYYSL